MFGRKRKKPIQEIPRDALCVLRSLASAGRHGHIERDDLIRLGERAYGLIRRYGPASLYLEVMWEDMGDPAVTLGQRPGCVPKSKHIRTMAKHIISNQGGDSSIIPEDKQ